MVLISPYLFFKALADKLIFKRIKCLQISLAFYLVDAYGDFFVVALASSFFVVDLFFWQKKLFARISLNNLLLC